MASLSGTPIRCTCDIHGQDQGPVGEARALVDGVSTVEDLITGLPSAARLPEELQRNLPSLRGAFAPPLNDAQKYSVLLGLVPRDLLCDAPDGLGQVASFLLPMLVAMIRSLPSGLRAAAGRGQCVPDTLILCATRQMCDEVVGIAEQLLQGTEVRCGRFGDPRRPPSDALLLVATLAELKDARSADLSQTFGLVLYGLGMMYDLGLAEDLKHLLEERRLPRKDVRQTMIFGQLQRKSDGLLKQAEEMLYSPIKISVNTCDRQVHHTWVYLTRAGKLERLSQLVSDWLRQGDRSSRILVIAHSSRQARAVDEHLRGSFAAAVIWKEEEEAKAAVCSENWCKFCCCEVQVISGSEAGVYDKDISFVRMIINFDPPQKVRNVRARFGKGLQRLHPRTEIVTFVTPEDCKDPEVFDLQALECMKSALGGEVPYQIERDTRAAAEGAQQETAWARGGGWDQSTWQERTWSQTAGGSNWSATYWDAAPRHDRNTAWQ